MRVLLAITTLAVVTVVIQATPAPPPPPPPPPPPAGTSQAPQPANTTQGDVCDCENGDLVCTATLPPDTFPSRCMANCMGVTAVKPCTMHHYRKNSMRCRCRRVFDPVCDAKDDTLRYRSRCVAKCTGNNNVKPCDTGNGNGSTTPN